MSAPRRYHGVSAIAIVAVLASLLYTPIANARPIDGQVMGSSVEKPVISEAVPADDPLSKVEPELWKSLETESSADFFVHLVEKADLGAAEKLGSKEEKGLYVYDALRMTAERSQRALRSYFDTSGVTYKPYYISNKILVRGGNRELIVSLASRPDVAYITVNHYFQLEKPRVNPRGSESIEAIGDNIAFLNTGQVWGLGIRGEGTVLAGNDTGLDWQHPAIINQYRGWDGSSVDHNYNWWDATGTYPLEPADGFGHGTHTTGTMVGDDGGDNQIGMAPGAMTIHCKNMDDGGFGSDEWFSTCFEWDLAPWDLSGSNPRPDLAPDAINNSWGYGGGGVPVFEDEIAALQAAGILVEVSAGNEGPSCSTLRSPGDYSSVLTTGSVSHASGVLPGTLTWFSSRGPSTLSPDYLPDIMAPGENVRSAIPGGGYENWDGTSMAGPHVTGLIGLMWSANPGLRGLVSETQQIIFNTTVPLSGQTGSNCGGNYTTGPNNDWGYGTIDAFLAVDTAMSFGGVGTLEGTVTDAVSTEPLEDVLVRAHLTPDLVWQSRTDAAGFYSRLVFSGTYTVTAELYGYYPAISTGIEVISGSITTHDILMDPAPTYVVSGTVTDAVSGTPLYARIDIRGYPYGSVWTDPVTGQYSIALAAGIEYQFTVSAWVEGYRTSVRTVGPLTAPTLEDFPLEPDLQACIAPGYVPEYVYYEDFEASDGGFTVEGFNTSWEWGEPSSGPRAAHSGVNAWATNLSGDYFDNEYGSIVSPEYDLSAYAGRMVIVSWWQWLQTESYYDYGWVEVSNDGGATWIWVYGDTGSINTSWTKYSYVLDPSFAVSNFRIRFTLQTDFSVTEPGFYVDDIGVGVADQPPVYYSQDFELDDGGYTVSGVTSWEWGVPTRGPGSAHSGSNAWATDLNGNYNNNEDGYITSPLMDLTGAAGDGLLLLSWWQWLQTESGYDFSGVEVSDGVSWMEVYTASGIIDTMWSQYSVVLDAATYGVADFQIRFHLRSDGMVTYPGFYIDDIDIETYLWGPPTVPCTPQAGGLVIGNIYDLNTSLSINGAMVQGSADAAISQATLEDNAVDDGFFILFAPEGVESLTATKAGYGVDVHSPTVILNSVIRQDFFLPAGLLSALPVSIEAQVDVGTSTTLSMTLENLGGVDASYEIRERGGDYIPVTRPVVEVPAFSAPVGSEAVPSAFYTGQSGYPLVSRASFTYQAPENGTYSLEGVSVLLAFSASVSELQSLLLAYPDLPVVDIFDAGGGTPTLDQLLAYGAVVVGGNYSFADPVALGDVLADYIDAGGTVVQTVPTFYDPGGSGWGLQGRFINDGYSPFIGVGDWFSWADLGAYDASHPIMEGVSYVGDYFRQVMDLNTDADWVASYTDDEFIATKGSVVALNTFLPDGYVWSGDIPLIVHNSIIWLQTAGDVPWLITDPMTGTVPSLGSQVVDVTLDASIPDVNQPGEYLAELRIVSNTPYEALSIPVTMTVNAPADWGRLAGTVVGLARCDAPGAPLSSASIDITDVAVTSTDLSGHFVYWMPEGSYEVTASADGFVAITGAVDIQGGQTTTLDFDLRSDEPCLLDLVTGIEATIPAGASISEMVALDNAGASDLTFSILESLQSLTMVAPAGVPDESQPDRADLIKTGPASVISLQARTTENELRLENSAGWFGGQDIPGGLIRYAFAQCAEQPESYYLFSGVNGEFNVSTKSWRYDTVTNTWTQLADVPAGGEAPSAACYQGNVYFMGGSGTDQFYIYHVGADEWTVADPLPRWVEGAAAAAWDGKVYLIGGDDDFYPYSGVSDQVDIYDIATGTWSLGSPMLVAAGNAGFAQLGQFLYIVGGWGVTSPDSNLFTTQRYDLLWDEWELGPEFSSARADFALAATEQALYALGGDKDGGSFFDATSVTERLELSGWPGGEWMAMDASLPVALMANNAGFCTQGLMDTLTAEVWSVGGIDTSYFLITGRTFFNERSAESCFSIYSDVAWLSESPVDGAVSADTQEEVAVTFDASDLEVGEYHATLALVSNDSALPIVYVPIHLTVVEPVYGMTISPTLDSMEGAAGSTVTYTLQLTNTGNIHDTYSLHTSAANWVTHVPMQIGPVAAGMGETLLITVEIPADASILATDTASLVIASQGDPGLSVMVELLTRVSAPNKIYMPWISR